MLNKRSTIIVALVWVTMTCAAAQETVPPAAPRIAVSTTEVDIGTVPVVDGTAYPVEIYNRGAGALEITEVAPLCTCVAADLRSLRVEPGATARLNILTMLVSYPANDVRGKVRLYSNDPAQPQLDILVHGQITPEYVIAPETIDFGKVTAGRPAGQTLVARGTDGAEKLQIRRVEASQGLQAVLQVQKRPKQQDQAGEAKTAPQYEFKVTLSDSLPPGPFRGLVTITTNCARLPRAEVKVSASITGLSYTVTPKVLAFGTASAGDELGAFLIHGDGIGVTSAQADRAGLTLDVEEIEPGTSYRVRVAADANVSVGSLLRLISIGISDGGRSEDAVVRVYGAIE